jgi:hypothetical protein
MSATSFDPVRGPREGMIRPEVSAGQRAGSVARRAVPTREDLVDLGFAAALTGIALYGFHTGFFGVMWVVAGVVGILLGLLVAHLGAAYRWPGVVTLAVLVAVYFLLGGAAAVRNHLVAGFVPSGRTLRDLAVTPIRGWKEWLTLLPPVDAFGALVALPFIVGLFGAALSYSIARRWQQPFLTALVPLALLAGSIFLGTMQPAGRLLQGAVAGLLLIGWMAMRAHRNRPPLQNGAGRQSRLAIGTVLLLVAGVVGYVAGPYLPGGGGPADREVARSYLTPPFDVAQFVSPLPGFRKYTEPSDTKNWDRVILRTRGVDPGTPVRFATLDSYDGSVFGAGNRASTGLSDPGKAFQQAGRRIANPAAGTPREVTFSIPEDGYSDAFLPTVGAVRGVQFAGPRSSELEENSWINLDTDTMITPDRVRPGDSWTQEVTIPPPTPEQLPGDVDLAAGTVAGAANTSFLDTAVSRMSGETGSPWQRVVNIAKYMQGQGAYTDGGVKSTERYYLPGHSLARLAFFTGTTQLAGNDEQYASTLALMAGRLGVPARVVMGAIPTTPDVIKGKDVHAWVEVKTSDDEWYPILPSQFLPDRSKKPNQLQLQQPQQKEGAQIPPPSGINPPSVLQGPDQAQNATSVKKPRISALDPSTWPWWLRLLVLYILLPLLLLALLVVAIGGLKAFRRRRHATRGAPATRIAWMWSDLMAEAKSVGVHVPRQATRLEQASLFEHDGPVPPLAVTANAHVFGPAVPGVEDSEAYWRDAGAARKALRAAMPWWRRVLTTADPRPLFTRGDRARVEQDRPGRRRTARRTRTA